MSRTEPDDLPFAVPRATRRLRLRGWAFLAAAALSAPLPLLGVIPLPGMGPLFTVVSAGFVVAGIVLLARSGSDAPVLEASEDGVTLTPGRRPVGPIPWDDIAAVEVQPINGILCLDVVRRGARPWSGRRGAFGAGSATAIAATLVDGSVHALRDRLERIRAARTRP